MKIIIAGGGTGGHLFPGIALSQSLTHLAPPTSHILFLCTDRPFDRRQLTRYGFNYAALPSPRFTPSLSFINNLIKSILVSYQEIKRFRPDYIIGLGGYGSFAPLLVAKWLNIPIILLEQNFLPGKITRWLSGWAKYVACQWSGSVKYLANPLRVRLTGSPVREEIKRFPRAETCRKLGIDPAKKVLTIIGGSQGASAINKFILANLGLLKTYRDKIALVHLCGKEDYPTLKESYEKSGFSYYLATFMDDMSVVYSSADLAICRAGGITIAELTALGIPAVLVPFPFSADNHQYYNGLEFSRAGAGVLVEQKDLSPDKLKKVIEEILLDEETLNRMVKASQSLGKSDSAREIFDNLLVDQARVK